MNLNTLEFSVILLNFGLILLLFALFLYHAKRYADIVFTLEESLNRKGAMKEMGQGIGRIISGSIGGNNKVKMQQNAFLRKLTKEYIPESLTGFLPEWAKDEIDQNPFLIPAVLRFAKAYKEAGFSGIKEEASQFVTENAEVLQSLAHIATDKIMKQESE